MYGLEHIKMYGEDLSYVLGVCDGDGCVYKEKIKHNMPFPSMRKDYADTYCIELKAKDKEFVGEFMQKLVRVTKRPDNRKPRSIFKSGNFWRVVVRSKQFGKFYFNSNWTGLLKQYPRGYLRGFYDSEGNLSYIKGRECIRLFNTEPKKIQLINQLLSLLNIKGHTRIYRKRGIPTNYSTNTIDLYVIQINGKSAKEFLEKIGSNIPRKQGGDENRRM